MIKEEKREQNLSITICVIIFCLFMTNLFSGVEGFYNISNISKLVIFLRLIYSMPVIIRRINKKVFVYSFLTGFIAIVQYILFPKNNLYFVNTFVTYITTIYPAVICFLVLHDYDKLLKGLIKTSFLVSAVCIVTFLVFKGNMFTSGYSMGFANIMILPIDLLIYYYFNVHKNKVYNFSCLLLLIFNIFLVFVFGSRGALINIFIFFIFQLLFSKRSSFKKVLSCFVSFFAIFIIIVFYQDILTLLIQLFNKIGLSSRTLYLLLNELMHDSGRRDIWNILLEQIKLYPYAVRGINADYLLVGIYSHNFIIEILYSFGIFIGFPMLIYILKNLYFTFFVSKNSYVVVLQLFMFSFFPLLLWSGSLWTNMFFWVWLLIFDRKFLIKE